MHADDIKPVAIIPDPNTGKCSVEADNGERFQVEPADPLWPSPSDHTLRTQYLTCYRQGFREAFDLEVCP